MKSKTVLSFLRHVAKVPSVNDEGRGLQAVPVTGKGNKRDLRAKLDKLLNKRTVSLSNMRYLELE